jgi:hypothetical protein
LSTAQLSQNFPVFLYSFSLTDTAIAISYYQL